MNSLRQSIRQLGAMLGVAITTLVSALAVSPVLADEQKPDPLAEIRFDQRLGAVLPLDALFRDEHGQDVRLASYFGAKPVILVPGYFRCRTLCPVTRDSLLEVLDQVGFTLGREFTIVSFSIDPQEGPTDALALQDEYSARYGRPGLAEGWHFLTGSQDSITQISGTIGYEAAYDEVTGQYGHAAGIVVATPEGRIARYFYGVDYQPFDLRLGLIEAAQNKIGNLVDQLLLRCYRYDPVGARYTPLVMTILRIGFVLVTLGLGIAIVWMSRRYRQPPPSASSMA